MTPQQKSELADDCDRLAQQMRNVGAKMQSWSLSPEMTTHAGEMLCAADIARDWAKQIRVLKTTDGNQ